MIHRLTSIFCTLGLFLLFAVAPTAMGEAIDFNTDTGVMRIDGTPSSTFFGVPMQTSVVDGKMQFRILGNLDFFSSDAVSAAGSRPLSLWAGNDVYVGSGAEFNFDAAFGQPGRLGGGNGGASANGGASGLGGTPGGPFGGAGGAGGCAGSTEACKAQQSPENRGRGGTGATGNYGRVGTPGHSSASGSAGLPGQAGFNNASGAQVGGAGGILVPGGNDTFPLSTAGGFGGAGGSIGFFSADNGSTGSNGNDVGGQVGGFPGPPGDTGRDGRDGLGGVNNVTGLLVSGGAGGSSGGGGSGGGGGASGNSGSGGGGGGGGGDVGVSNAKSGAGGNGGSGGDGGRGGDGSRGGAGGVGGAGGGAVEIVAQGRIQFAGSISMRGADGDQGNFAGFPQNGSAGAAGNAGERGHSSEGGGAGNGGDGGTGAVGSRGGDGGFGGTGGYGGGGAGGTVLFKSTLFTAAGGKVAASGGFSWNLKAESFGGDGRYLTAENGHYLPNYGTVEGARREDFYNEGSSGLNPFVQGNSTITANVIGLAGGADVYGLKGGVSAADSYFDTVRAGAPAGAVAAIMRRAVGPTDGEAYWLRDLLMMVNLTNGPLANPMLGVGAAGSGFQTALLQQGFARNPVFGGGGPAVLSALPAGSVFATLIPIPTGSTFYEVNAFAGGGQTTVAFNTLNIAYIIPAVLAGDYNHDGKVDAADYVAWRKNPGGFAANAYTTWRLNFGQPAGSGSGAIANAAVPEPSTLVLLIVAAVGLGLSCRHFA